MISEPVAPPVAYVQARTQILSSIRDKARATYLALTDFLASREIESADLARIQKASNDALGFLRELDAVIAKGKRDRGS